MRHNARLKLCCKVHKSVRNFLVFAFFITTCGTIYAPAQTKGWGENTLGNIGDGTTVSPRPTPVIINGLTDITAFGGGERHAIALKSNGTVVSWGNNQNGQRGDGTTSTNSCQCNPNPGVVPGLNNIVQVSAGVYHSLVLRADGTVWAWGDNSVGELGNGTQTNSAIPVQVGQGVSGFNNIIAIDAGSYHNLALKADGTVWAWGFNFHGQVRANGQSGASVQLVLSPVQTAGVSNIISISAGENFSVFLKDDGRVQVAGYNIHGQVGNGTQNPDGCNCVATPTHSSIIGVAQIAAGFRHIVALKQDGTVWAWGYNFNGELGVGYATTTSPAGVPDPTQVLNLNGIADIRTSGHHTIARKSDGSLWAWGRNGFGQVRADGTTDPKIPTPAQIANVNPSDAVIGTNYFASFVSAPVNPVNTGNNVFLAGDNFNLTFDSVTGAGNTNVSAINPSAQGLSVPSGHRIQSNTIGYNISTDAVYNGNIRVCLKVPSVSSPVLFNALILYHGEGGQWVDRTVSRDYLKREVCGAVTSLSPFAVGRPNIITAAGVTVSGRVMNFYGRSIAGARVTLNDGAGNTRTVNSNFFGYYRFADVPAGATYMFEVAAKQYQFQPQAATINEARSDLNFTAMPN